MSLEIHFTQIDFNRVQLLHKQELSILSRWWNDLNFAEELPYARDRIVGIYFWANGIHFEPQYAFSGMIASKYTKFVSLVDDAYDANASFKFRKGRVIFCHNFRCFMNAMGIFSTKLRMIWESKDDPMPHIMWRQYEYFSKVVRGYHAEAEWADKCHVPTSDEYVLNGLATCACGLLMAAFFLGLEEVAEVAGVEEYEWLKSKPKIIKSNPKIIQKLRLI
uniref:Terpene synthase metal-binding domain-containing protein n=1 Tax=Salix viminalis TaxID=40686 RepID=A0A6N2LJA6_SALVM